MRTGWQHGAMLRAKARQASADGRNSGSRTGCTAGTITCIYLSWTLVDWRVPSVTEYDAAAVLGCLVEMDAETVKRGFEERRRITGYSPLHGVARHAVTDADVHALDERSARTAEIIRPHASGL